MGFRLKVALVLVLTGALVIGALVIGIGYPLVKAVFAQLQDTEHTLIKAFARLARDPLQVQDYRNLQAMVEEAVRDPLIEAITIADHRGIIVASSDRHIVGLPLLPPDEPPGLRWMTLPIQGERAPLGVIDMWFAEGMWRKTFDTLKNALLAVGLGGGLVIFALSWTVASALTRRLGVIVKAAERVGRGDFDVSLPIKGEDEVATLARALDHMLKRLKQAMDTIKEAEERYRLAVEGSEQAIWEWNLEDNRMFYSPRMAEMLGYPYNELPAFFHGLLQFIHPEDRPRFEQALKDHLERRSPFRIEIRLHRKDGGWIWVALRGKAAQAKMLGSCADVTPLKEAEARLKGTLQRLRVILESLAEGVILVDGAGRTLFMNPAASAWLGGAPVKTFLPQEALHPRQPQFSFGFEREGRFFEGVASPVPRGGGVIALRDVTERHRLMERLAYQATHDDLTGLYNRRALLEHLRSFPGGAMAFLDVDGFASLNESLGDEAGDALLHMVAAFLEAKADGFVARAGGDEFAWLLEGVSLQEALERVHQLVEGARRLRFSWKGRLYPVSLSAGVVAFSKGLPEEEMLGASEHCLMLAKNMGWGSVKGCSLADPAFSEVKAHFDAFRRLDRAIREHQLILFAQPIIPLHGEEKGAHYEILLRVKDEAGRIVPPGGYLEAAKRFRLLTQVDRFVLNMVADFLSALQAHGEVVCSVNLSGASVGDENTLSFIQQLIDTHRLSPQSLVFEITESVAISDMASAQQLVKVLKEQGCRFSIDDFGSGFASFSYIKDFDFDYLKIDGSFVQGMQENELDKLVVDAACRLGHAVGAKVIAEFVDSEAIASALRALGVDYAQGYYFGRPIPLYEAIS